MLGWIIGGVVSLIVWGLWALHVAAAADQRKQNQ